MKKKLVTIVTGLSLFVAGAAHAAGLELDASALPAKARSQLASDIAQERARSPHLFKSVALAIANANALDAHARRRGMPFTPRFKALGRNALMPMLDALAFDGHAPSDLSESASSALRVGLLEAIGSIRDDRAIPVLEQVLAHAKDERITRASATALARIGTDASIAVLLRAEEAAHVSEPNGPRARALLAGMHDARRASVAKLLASRLDAAPDEATAKVVAHSLGGVANAWAWHATTDKSELDSTREAASRALVRAFVRRSGEAREAAVKALLVVDDPKTPSLVADARNGASADLKAALDELERRFANNPARLTP